MGQVKRHLYAIQDLKIRALQKHHEDHYDEICGDDLDFGYVEHLCTTDHGEFMVLTEEEADDAAHNSICDSVWAFVSWFLADHMPDGLTSEDVDRLRGDSCEGINDAFLALIKAGSGVGEFVEDAVSQDGRGHFLSSYDGEEHEVEVDGELFMIYRVN